MESTLLVCSARPSRRRAIPLACAEVAALFEPFGAKIVQGGPLSEHPGVFWATVDAARIPEIEERAARLGYTHRLEQVGLEPPARSRKKEKLQNPTWKGKAYTLSLLWLDSEENHRQSAPDRRTFSLRQTDGTVRKVKGYRGSGGLGQRRALPVADARLLVNLARAEAGQVLLDPFAGAGGIVFEASHIGAEVWSIDIDPTLEPGLTAFGARHTIASATHLPFETSSVHGVATEPPFDPDSDATVQNALGEIARVLVLGGRAAIMVANRQKNLIEQTSVDINLRIELSCDVDRKGTPVTIFLLQKNQSRCSKSTCTSRAVRPRLKGDPTKP